jgi:hypothetical protein
MPLLSQILSADKGWTITPDNDNDISAVTRCLYIGGEGTVVVILEDDTEAITVEGLAVGIFHPMRVRRVLATGTTATNIIGFN